MAQEIRRIGEHLIEGVRRLTRRETSDKTREQPKTLSEQRIHAVREIMPKMEDENIRAILVFGSVAGGTATELSDLDYHIIKQRNSGLPGAYEKDDISVIQYLSSQLSFPTHPVGSSSLEEIADPTIPDLLLMQLTPPSELRELGVKTTGFRDNEKPFITNWVIVARTQKEEAEITDQITKGLEGFKNSKAK